MSSSHLNEQFSTLSVNASYLLTIVSSVMFSKPSKLSEIMAQYQHDLQSYWGMKCADGSLNTCSTVPADKLTIRSHHRV